MDQQDTMDDKYRPGTFIDPVYLVNALIDLQLALRKTLLYSTSHASIADAARRLKEKFAIVFQFVDTASFGITKDEVLYQGSPIGGKNAIVRELARTLNKLNLAGMTLKKEISINDILAFLQMISQARSLPIRDREERFDRFHREFRSVRLQFISLSDAVKARTEDPPVLDAPTRDLAPGSSEKGLWHGLVNRLLYEHATLPASSPVRYDPQHIADPQIMAQFINSQVPDNETSENSYHHEIVKYLQAESRRHDLTSEKRLHVAKQLGTFISNLRLDIREQIFRVSLEPTHEGKAPLEDFMEVMPTSVLLEVINQIQFTDQAISDPMFNLLKKFVALSDSDQELRESLESKLTDHKNIFEDLFVKRADREFYPSSYRSLLDTNLSGKPLDARAPDEARSNIKEDEETCRHLAWIILELLDRPMDSREQYEGLVHLLDQLLETGLEGNAQFITIESMWILMKGHGEAGHDHAAFFEQQIKNFFESGRLIHLLEASHPDQEKKRIEILGNITTFSGPELIQALLDLLETEERLTIRKRIMEITGRCGRAVIPFAVQKLQSEKWYVVRNMLLLLRELQANEELPHIAQCLRHDSPKVRLVSLQVLIALGADGEVLYPALALSLDDPDIKVFRAAGSYLVSRRDPRAFDLVRAQFLDTHPVKNHKKKQLELLKFMEKSGTRHLIPVLSELSDRLQSNLEHERIQSRLKMRWRFWKRDHQRTLHNALKTAIRKISERKGLSHA